MDRSNQKKYTVTTDVQLQKMIQIIEDKNKTIKYIEERNEFLQSILDKFIDSLVKRDTRVYEEQLNEIAEDTETHIEFSKYFKQTLKKLAL